MAVDFGDGNTTRRYTVPDSADFTLPNDDWTWLIAGEITRTSDHSYGISTNGYAAVNSVNLLSGVGGEIAIAYEDTIQESIAGGASTNTPFILAGRRISGTLDIAIINIGSSSVNKSSGTSIAGTTSNGSGLWIGSRSDLNTTRHWDGPFTYAALVTGDYVSDDDLIALSNGAPLLAMPFASSLVEVFHFQSSTASTVSGLIKGHVATQAGTSYGTNEEDLITPYADEVNYIYSAAAVGGFTPKGVFSRVFTGPFGGPI